MGSAMNDPAQLLVASIRGQSAKKRRSFPEGDTPQQGTIHQVNKMVNDRFWLVRVIAYSRVYGAKIVICQMKSELVQSTRWITRAILPSPLRGLYDMSWVIQNITLLKNAPGVFFEIASHHGPPGQHIK